MTYKYEGYSYKEGARAKVPTTAPALPTAQSYEAGSAVTAASVAAPSGWEFSGWKAEGSSVEIEEGGTFSMPEGNVTLVGSWMPTGVEDITTKGIDTTYDGKEHYIEVTGAAPNDTFTVISDDAVHEGGLAFKNHREETVNVEVVRDGVTVASIPTKVNIEQRPVMVKGHVEKVYDGTTDLVNNMQFTIGGAAEGDDDLAISSLMAGILQKCFAFSTPDVQTDANLAFKMNVAQTYELLPIFDNDEHYNYTLGDFKPTGTIVQRPIDVTIPSQSKVYDGSAAVASAGGSISLQIAAATGADDGIVAGDALVASIDAEDVAYATADVHEGAALKASARDAKLSGAKAGNYRVRSITGAGSITAAGTEGFTFDATGYTGVYDGKAHDGVTDATVRKASGEGSAEDDAAWDITYALTKDGPYSSEVPQVTNVDDSTVIYIRAENPNYGTLTTQVNAAVSPATITVTADGKTKVQGHGDPILTSTYKGAVNGEVPGWEGAIARVPGEAPGSYAIQQGTLALADNANGSFDASNYKLVFTDAVFTISALTAGGGQISGGNPGVTPEQVTPSAPAPLPVVAAPTAAAPVAANPEADELIADDANPLASAEGIDDDGTPLAAAAHLRECWVHWLILLGIVVNAVYFIGGWLHRRKFTGDLKGYENDVLGSDKRADA